MNINIRYLFSKNEKPGSQMISWGTAHLEKSIDPTPSHVAVLINEKWVVESTLESGFRVISYTKWKQINNELYSIDCIQDWTMDDIKGIFRPLKSKKYDYMGVIYFSYRIALNKYFNRPLPKYNVFNHADRYFCCEVISEMTGVSYEMTAPVQLYSKLTQGVPNAEN